VSSAGIDLICRFEGFLDHIYRDAAGYPILSYGHLLRPVAGRNGTQKRSIFTIEQMREHVAAPPLPNDGAATPPAFCP
jgi:GH24 family phage-related lysozyme (muramidase)